MATASRAADTSDDLASTLAKHSTEVRPGHCITKREAVVVAPSPPAGAGSSAAQQKRMGEGARIGVSPHPTVLVAPLSCPLPQGGEGAVTTAALHGTATHCSRF